MGALPSDQRRKRRPGRMGDDFHAHQSIPKCWNAFLIGSPSPLYHSLRTFSSSGMVASAQGKPRASRRVGLTAAMAIEGQPVGLV